MLTLSWKKAVAFFTALGFGKSKEWSQAKMMTMLSGTPERIKPEYAEEAGEEHFSLYKQLKDAGGKVELTGGPAAEQEEDETETPAKKGKTVKKKAAKNGKPAKRPSRAKKSDRKVDWLGMGIDTIRGKVNKHVTKEWVTEDEIIKGSGVKKKQAQLRLRQAVKAKQFERRRRTEYRILPSLASKAK